jgi:hypothetical protein
MKTQTTNAIRPDLTLISPDFTHRYVSSFYNDSDDLSDSIGLMTSRALSILALISGNFESHDSIINHDVIYSALDSVVQELNDIQAYAREFAIKNPR